MKIWTAQYRYPGPSRLDITVKGCDPVGSIFAPSWDMVKHYKNDMLQSPKQAQQVYTDAYHMRMRDSMFKHADVIQDLLQRSEAVLVCFCKAGDFCHRLLLKDILVELGAEYNGEITDFSHWNMPSVIDSFSGQFRWLSNFWVAPMLVNGLEYSSNEHFFQASKAYVAEDHESIRLCDTPGKTKRLGKKVLLRPDWDLVKIDVMREGLVAKFKHQGLQDKLKATKGVELIEGNTWHDNFWGNCVCPKCKHVAGSNWLGKLLMEIRDKI